MSDQPSAKKPIYKRWWVWVLAVVVVIAIGSSIGGEDSSDPAAATSSASSSPSESPTATPKASSSPDSEETSRDDQREQIARQIKKKIGLDAIGFPGCKWKSDSDQSDAIVQVASCDKHQIMIAVDPDHTSIKVWMDSMKGQMDAGWGLVGDNHAVVSPDQSTIFRIRDLLGGKDSVVNFAD